MTKACVHIAFGLCVGFAVVGCKEQGGTGGPSSAAPSTQPAGTSAAVPSTVPATTAAAEPGANSLFTLPPSKGPAAHKFQQVGLMRSGPSGDLEMQLTGDGIYRIRDHGHGRSYAGDGKLTDDQIAQWAEAMKGWEALKESYLPSPVPATADTVEIMYGGKKVVADGLAKDNPKTFAVAYQRLLDLNEQVKKEAAADSAAEPAKETKAPLAKDGSATEPQPSTDPVKKDAKEVSPKGVTPDAADQK
jgi:hypothetical protein